MPGREAGKRALALDGTLRFETDGAAVTVIADGSEVRIDTSELRSVRWSPRLAWSSAELLLRLSRRFGRAGLRLRFVRRPIAKRERPSDSQP